MNQVSQRKPVDVQLQAAEVVLRQAGRELAAWGRTDALCPALDRARMRLVVAHVVRACRDGITQLMEASGASAHLRSNPPQRIQRDVNTLSRHTVFDLEMGAENYGRLLLGMEPATPV